MQFTILKPVKTTATHFTISAPGELIESFPNTPGSLPRCGFWRITVELTTGKVLEWDPGYGAEFITAVVGDKGTYCLKRINGSGQEIIVAALTDFYVPLQVMPGIFPDVISLDVTADGIIRNWRKPEQIHLDGFAAIGQTAIHWQVL